MEDSAATAAQAAKSPPVVVDLASSQEATMASQAAFSPEEEPEEEEDEQLFLGTVNFSIVGIRYYKGEAHPGEYVHLKREPHNPYDRLAIRVDNMNGEKVGHIKAVQAAASAPIMDDSSLEVTLDGTIPRSGNQWNLPLQLDFYGRDLSLAVEVGRMLKRGGIGLQRSPLAETTPNSSKAAAAPTVAVQKKTIDWRTEQKQLDDMFEEQSKTQLANLPPIDMPSALQVELFDHQVTGIRWMVHRETGNIQPPFFKQVKEQGKTMWLSEITNSSQSTPPKPVCGGILADDMGLGKTIQALGLILAAPPKGRDYNISLSAKPAANTKPPSKAALKKLTPAILQRVLKDAHFQSIPTTKGGLVDACAEGFKAGTITMEQFSKSTSSPQTTLIVCPVSVMQNWVSQIESHVKDDTLRMELYHGSNRHDLLNQLGQIDVLISSYQTISFDFGPLDPKAKSGKPPAAKKRKQSSLLFESQFHRIILDEAHTIRSSKTRTYRACTSLLSGRKFCLTGTPLTNKPDDIQSLFSFLGVEPLGDKDVFRRAVAQPIQAGDEVGLARLRAMMSHVTLRRNKSLVNIVMPDKQVELRLVEFPNDSPHKTIHKTIFQTAQAAFQATLQAGDSEALKNYMSVLETLLRIRQACCSGVLVPQERLERAEQVLSELEGRDGKALSAEEGKALLDKLKGTFEEENVECAVCLCEMQENGAVILRSCAHVFCPTCIARVAGGAHSNCPLCRVSFTSKDMIEKSAASKAVDSSSESIVPVSQSMDELGPSPKIAALLQAIGEMKAGEKGVIFSQFTKFLDEVAKHLDASELSHARIDGKKTAVQRIEAMKAFASETEGPQIMLCSLHTAGTGINLTRANHVFMLDTWWNKAAELQAFDRVHRIGQKRAVRIVRFVMAGSIEERMVSLQETKAAIAKGSMEKLKPEEVRKARIGDLKSLFDIVTE